MTQAAIFRREDYLASIPVKNYRSVPVEPVAGNIAIDTNNESRPGYGDYVCAELNNRTNSLKSSSFTSDTTQMDMPSCTQ